MEQHVKVLAILNIVYGAMIALAGVVVLLIFGGLAGLAGMSDDQGAEVGAGVLGLFATILPIILFVIAAPSIIAGVGLLKYQGWARILTIILSAIHLFGFPLGTALGVYGFWTLLRPETELLFRPRPQSWPSPAV